MSMTSMVVLGLSVATVLLLLGGLPGHHATGQEGPHDPSRQCEVAPAEPPLAAPVSVPGRAGTDYVDPRTIKVGDKIDVHGSPARVLGAMYVSWQGRSGPNTCCATASGAIQWLSVELRGA